MPGMLNVHARCNDRTGLGPGLSAILAGAQPVAIDDHEAAVVELDERAVFCTFQWRAARVDPALIRLREAIG